MTKAQTPQTFNDGIVGIYTIADISAPGDMPKDGLKLKETLRFKQRTVGFSRYYTAMQAQQKVDCVIRCPFRNVVSAQDVVILNNVQYRIGLIQRLEDSVPPVMDLTLSRLEQEYEI